MVVIWVIKMKSETSQERRLSWIELADLYNWPRWVEWAIQKASDIITQDTRLMDRKMDRRNDYVLTFWDDCPFRLLPKQPVKKLLSGR
jgi:hypothetical protein